MSGFTFTPNGLVPLAAPSPGDGVASQPRPAFVPHLPPTREAPPVARRAQRSAPEKPLDVLKLARARLRFLDREIARMKKLEKERDELRNLLDAASNKPRAVVRDISAAKRG